MRTKSPSKSTEAHALEAGVREAFGCWLEVHSATAPEALLLGVQTAVGQWLDDHQYRIEEILREEAANVTKEVMPRDTQD